MLSKISTYEGVRKRKPSSILPGRPIFLCVDIGTHIRHAEIGYDPFKLCTSDNSAWAVGGAHSRYISLCSRFWSQPIDLLPGREKSEVCPIILENNTWDELDSRISLIMVQKYLLVHEMVHYYLERGGLGYSTKPKEVYSANLCNRLGDKDRLKNANNYEYYVGCELSGILLRLICISSVCIFLLRRIPSWCKKN